LIARLNLAAARIGDLAAARLASLPEPGTVGNVGTVGRVESVYRSAVNVAFGGAWSVCLLPAGAPLHPYAVTVAVAVAGEGAGDRSAFLAAYPGEPVLLSKHSIEFGDGRLSISLDGARVWDLRLEPVLRGAVDLGQVRNAIWRGVVAEMGEESGTGDPAPAVGERGNAAHWVTSHFLRAVMESRGIALDCDRGPAGLMAEATRNRLAELREALLARPAAGGETRADALAESLGRLVGFGEGLTPSGDDFLLGLLAASRLGPAAGRAPLDKAIAGVLPTFAAATTRESSRMLEAAVAGNYPEPIVGLLAAIGDDPDGVRRWVGCLRELGGTSGQDMLAGVLAWLGGQGREHQQASDALLCRAAGGV
jgi:hypothetical protein